MILPNNNHIREALILNPEKTRQPQSDSAFNTSHEKNIPKTGEENHLMISNRQVLKGSFSQLIITNLYGEDDDEDGDYNYTYHDDDVMRYDGYGEQSGDQDDGDDDTL